MWRARAEISKMCGSTAEEAALSKRSAPAELAMPHMALEER